MGRVVFVVVLSGLLFGGAGIALGRATDRATPAVSGAAVEECAVVTLPEAEAALAPTTARGTTEPAGVEPGVETGTTRGGWVGGDGEASEPGAPRVRRLVVTSGIDGHEPIDELDEVRVGAGPVYAFVDAANAGGATSLRVTFERADSSRSTGRIELEVPAHARRHRTWAYTRGVRAEGLWHAVVRDEHGTELARAPFDVIAPE